MSPEGRGQRPASALERMAARLLAQRAHLAQAARLIETIPGPVLEIGLGKGRTYSHLRSLLGDRAIYCFDRELHAPADDAPPPENLFLGEFSATLPRAATRLGCRVALAHCDFGTRHAVVDSGVADYLAGALPALMAPGGIVAADRALTSPRLQPVPSLRRSEPPDLPHWDYYVYRAA